MSLRTISEACLPAGSPIDRGAPSDAPSAVGQRLWVTVLTDVGRRRVLYDLTDGTDIHAARVHAVHRARRLLGDQDGDTVAVIPDDVESNSTAVVPHTWLADRVQVHARDERTLS